MFSSSFGALHNSFVEWVVTGDRHKVRGGALADFV